MTKPLIAIFNCETQEEIIREMNDVEYAQYLIDTEVVPPVEEEVIND